MVHALAINRGPLSAGKIARLVEPRTEKTERAFSLFPPESSNVIPSQIRIHLRMKQIMLIGPERAQISKPGDNKGDNGLRVSESV